MSSREHYWAWLHPKAQEGDRMAYPRSQTANVLKREESVNPVTGREEVRFLIAVEGDMLFGRQWVGPVLRHVPPHMRETYFRTERSPRST